MYTTIEGKQTTYNNQQHTTINSKQQSTINSKRHSTINGKQHTANIKQLATNNRSGRKN
jgi:hypothetical protein